MAIDVKGMTIEDIRSLNTRGLSLSELRAVTTRLVSAANKRVRRLQADEYGRYSLTAQAASERAAAGRGKLFQTKGLDTRAKVKAEFDRARAFLDPSKTSHTVKGWKQTVKKMEKAGVSKENLAKPEFWAMYRHFYSEYVPGQYTSDSLLAMISIGRDVKNIDNYEDMKDWLDGTYEEREEGEQEDTIGDVEEEFGDYYD